MQNEGVTVQNPQKKFAEGLLEQRIDEMEEGEAFDAISGILCVEISVFYTVLYYFLQRRFLVVVSCCIIPFFCLVVILLPKSNVGIDRWV